MDSSTSFPLSLLITVLALAAVLAIAWLSIKALASFSKGNLKGGRVKVLQSVPLGARERLTLVQIDDTELLLGVTAAGITLLRSGSTSTLATPAETDFAETR